MPSKKVTKSEKSTKTIPLGDFLATITAMPARNGICSWLMNIVEKESDKGVACFRKGATKKDYIVTIGKQPFPINNNGVQATYLEWRVAVEKIIGVEIAWQPQGREMFKYSI